MLEERDTAGERLPESVFRRLADEDMVPPGALAVAQDDALALSVTASVESGVAVVEYESTVLPVAEPLCVIEIMGESVEAAVFDSSRADEETVRVASWVCRAVRDSDCGGDCDTVTLDDAESVAREDNVDVPLPLDDAETDAVSKSKSEAEETGESDGNSVSVGSGVVLGSLTVDDDEGDREAAAVPVVDALGALTDGVEVTVDVALSDIRDDADGLLEEVTVAVCVASGENEGVIVAVLDSVASVDRVGSGVGVGGAVAALEKDETEDCVCCEVALSESESTDEPEDVGDVWPESDATADVDRLAGSEMVAIELTLTDAERLAAPVNEVIPVEVPETETNEVDVAVAQDVNDAVLHEDTEIDDRCDADSLLFPESEARGVLE